MTEREALFRPEVILHRADRSLGAPLLRHNVLTNGLVGLAVALVLSALILLVVTQYKETAAARGILVATTGAHRINAPIAATVQHIAVTAGATVRKGQVLAALTRTTYSQEGRNVQQEEMAQLQAQHALLLEEQQLQTRQYQQQRQQGLKVLDALASAANLLHGEKALLQQQLQLSETKLLGMQQLANAHAVPVAQLQQSQVEHLGFQLRLQDAAQRQQGNVQRSDAQQAYLANLALDYQRARLRAQQTLQQLEFTMAQHQHQAQLTVVAAADGVVATIAIENGDSVQAQQPLFYMAAPSAELGATLYVPSRLLGQMYPGQEILLSYDAFDYQHFGRYRATVTHIEQASLDPREHLLPVPGLQEPVFRISARLEQTYVEGPDVYRLQSGMLFNADIVLAEMSLLEFMFKPVLRLRARLS